MAVKFTLVLDHMLHEGGTKYYNVAIITASDGSSSIALSEKFTHWGKVGLAGRVKNVDIRKDVISEKLARGYKVVSRKNFEFTIRKTFVENISQALLFKHLSAIKELPSLLAHDIASWVVDSHAVGAKQAEPLSDDDDGDDDDTPAVAPAKKAKVDNSSMPEWGSW